VSCLYTHLASHSDTGTASNSWFSSNSVIFNRTLTWIGIHSGPKESFHRTQSLWRQTYRRATTLRKCSILLPLSRLLMLYLICQIQTESLLSLKPQASRPNATDLTDSMTDRDSTDEGLNTDNISERPGKVGPAPCLATTSAGLPAGPFLAPGGQGHIVTYSPTVVESPTHQVISCGASYLLFCCKQEVQCWPPVNQHRKRTWHYPQLKPQHNTKREIQQY